MMVDTMDVGAYPFTANNYIYASDMQNGLYILILKKYLQDMLMELCTMKILHL